MIKFLLIFAVALFLLYPISKGLLVGVYYIGDCDIAVQACAQLPFDESYLWGAAYFVIEALPFFAFPLALVALFIAGAMMLGKLFFKVAKSGADDTER